jgi:excisionase family DNA binding protein
MATSSSGNRFRHCTAEQGHGDTVNHLISPQTASLNLVYPMLLDKLGARITESDMAIADEWLTAEETAERLKVSLDLVYKLIKRKNLPAHKVGRSWRFSRSELDAWVKADRGSTDDGEAQSA